MNEWVKPVLIWVLVFVMLFIAYKLNENIQESNRCCTRWECPFDTSFVQSLFQNDTTVGNITFQNKTYQLGDMIWLRAKTNECQRKAYTDEDKLFMPFPLYLDNVSRECRCVGR